MSGQSWCGQVIGPWLVIEPFRTARGQSAYRCINVEARKVVGVSAYRLARKVRDGDEPQPVAADRLAEAVRKVRPDPQQGVPDASSFDREGIA